MNVIYVLLSSLFMFFIGNIGNWLMPMLKDKGFPEWVYNSIGFYSILYVAAAGLNALFLKKVITDSELLKSVKNYRATIVKLKKEHKIELKDKLFDCDRTKGLQILALQSRVKELEDEVEKKEILINELGGNLLMQIEKTTTLRRTAHKEYNSDSRSEANNNEASSYNSIIASRHRS